MTDNVLSIDEFKQRKADSNAVQGCMNHLNDLYSLRREKILRLSTESFIRPVMDILKCYITSLGLRMQNVKDILDAIDFCVVVDSDVPIQPASQRNYTFPFSDKVPICATFKIADSLAFAGENKARSIFEGFGLHCTLTHQAATGEDSISIQGVKCNSNYDTYSFGVSSVVLCDAMRQLGFVENKKLRGKDDKSPSYRKEVPQAILKSSVACRLAFLAGFVEGDGSVRTRTNSKGTTIAVKFYSRSRRLLRQVQIMLADLGYASTRAKTYLGVRESLSPDLYLCMKPYMVGYKSDVQFDVYSHGRVMGIPIAPIAEWLQSRFLRYEVNVGSWFATDDGREVLIQKFAGRVTSVLGNLSAPRNGVIPYHSIDHGLVDDFISIVREVSPGVAKNIEKLYELRYVFDPVVRVKHTGKEHVYDLSIERAKEPAFVANDFIVFSHRASSNDYRGKQRRIICKYNR
jgi:hypothetical protein